MDQLQRQSGSEHTSEPHQKDSAHSEYVGDFVFGGIDGVVTTFAVVAGVAGANLSPAVILVLGIANLLADGFAMGVGNYLSLRSERERYAKETERERWEIETYPESQRTKVKEMYAAKGVHGAALQEVVNAITNNKETWLATMVREGAGLAEDTRSPLKGGLITYLAFIIIGAIPLLSFAAASLMPTLTPHTFAASVALTMLALFVIGALKTLVVRRSFIRSGLETLIMGGIAALVAYAVGYLLRGLV